MTVGELHEWATDKGYKRTGSGMWLKGAARLVLVEIGVGYDYLRIDVNYPHVGWLRRSGQFLHKMKIADGRLIGQES